MRRELAQCGQIVFPDIASYFLKKCDCVTLSKRINDMTSKGTYGSLRPILRLLETCTTTPFLYLRLLLATQTMRVWVNQGPALIPFLLNIVLDTVSVHI